MRDERMEKDPMQTLKTTIWIGKQGCTDTIISEIKLQLEKRRIVKIKWLQNAEVDPREIATLVKATLVSVRGHTMVLTKR